jgi:hypothetical protein
MTKPTHFAVVCTPPRQPTGACPAPFLKSRSKIRACVRGGHPPMWARLTRSHTYVKTVLYAPLRYTPERSARQLRRTLVRLCRPPRYRVATTDLTIPTMRHAWLRCLLDTRCHVAAPQGRRLQTGLSGTQWTPTVVVYWRVKANPIVGHHPLLVSRTRPRPSHREPATCHGSYGLWRQIPFTTLLATSPIYMCPHVRSRPGPLIVPAPRQRGPVRPPSSETPALIKALFAYAFRTSQPLQASVLHAAHSVVQYQQITHRTS